MPMSVGCRRRGPAARRVAAALLAVLATGACSLVGDIRRTAPPRADKPPAARPNARAGTNWLVETAPGTVDVRTATVDVPREFDRHVVEFSDAWHGVAMFLRCPPAGAASPPRDRCSARLLFTQDGGRTWHGQPHPQPTATDHRLHLGPDGTVLLLAEPHGWYLSRDSGGTFRQLSGGTHTPPEYQQLTGPFQLCCDGERPPRVVRWVDARAEPVPAQPALPGGPQSLAHRSGRDLWTASAAGGRPHSMVSSDEGRTWRPVEVPAPAVGGVVRVTLRTSADRADLWLVGSAEDRRVLAYWRLDGDAWRRLPETGASALPSDAAAVAPAGSGLLVVAGRGAGGGLLGERYTPTDWPLAGWVDVLRDGTLVAPDRRTEAVWLARGEGAVRRWARVEFRQP